MSENTSADTTPATNSEATKGDKLFDAFAAVALLSIVIATVVFWVSSQG